MAKSASDYARELFSQLQQKAAPAVQSVVGNIGNFVAQDIKRAPIVKQVNAISQIKPNFTGVTQGINSVGKFIGQQPIINNAPISLVPKIPSPTILQTAQTVAPIIGGQKANPATSFLTGNVQKIPSQINTNINQSFGPPKKGETQQQYIARTNGAAQGVVNFGFAKPALSKAADYLAKTGDREAIRKISDFIIDVQKTGGKKNYGTAGQEIQAIATDVFGEKARTLDNKQLANLLDATLKSVGKKGKFGLGLATDNIREGQFPITDTQKYIQELTSKQKLAGSNKTGIIQKGKDFLTNLKTQLVDSAFPIEDALTLAEKKGKFKVRPTGDIRLQIDRVLRSKSLASQFAEDNGLTNVIKNAPDLNALDQYMIAKQAARVSGLGKTTGRDAARDAQLIQDLAPEYEQHAQAVNQYSRKLLDYSVKTGLIDKNLATELINKYPDYVPLNRIFNELEQNGYQGATKSIANLSKQTVVQGLKGSEREIQSPLESLLLKTQTAFQQGEKNQAAKMLASYKDLPGFEGLIKEGGNSAHKFSYLENGVKKSFDTTPEIASAAKNLNKEQMNIVTKILSYPTRALQLGATGLNVPFAVTNLAKDQVTAFVNSNKAASTSLLNPVNFVKSLFAAVGHNDLYKEVVRNAGVSTSFDVARNEADLAVSKIRAGRSVGSQILHTVRNPAELLRALENTIGRTEELTRVQNYKGTYDALIKEGRTPQDARLLAAQAARNNTANFARSGDLGKVINFVIPFFNAGIQGSRSFLRAAKQNPVSTGAKLTASLFLPMATATLWNTTDPKRNQIYQDIQESDKERNIIIIPDGATQDASGKWNVIKIPLPSGLGNLASLVRRGVEQTQGGNPVAAKEVFDSLVGAATPLDTSSPTKLIGGLTPQAIKPFVEGVTNTNLYTGNKIVPDSMKDLPPDQQVKPNTSPLAKTVGKFVGQSPLLVEDAANTALGGVGGQILGKNPLQQLQGRFAQASGGEQQNKEFDTIQQYQTNQAVDSQKKKQTLTRIATILMDPNEDRDKKVQLIQAISQDKQLFGELKNQIRDNTQKVDAADRAVRGLSLKQRASYIKTKLQPLSKEEKRTLVIQYIKKGILTKEVVKELKTQLSQ